MDALRLSQQLEQLQTELACLQAEVKRLEALYIHQATGQTTRITMAEAENQLGVSHFHIHRLMGAGVIQSGQRMGAGKNAQWTFEHAEILKLVDNPSYLTIEPVS
ncbi:hypothetical protein QNI16_10375 [Cytophagaceae bacterium YF14B1]|uniref:Helix-turn-helix domain-containing protein n=1 Tax=Xanthocytophaga flava TaxID=3048013 RepID=A0AAE3U8P0_9BACT|nr:hypothetical protein [Xanthocytophaga flavus]MDJ1480889.1 hypothetical protein [Xanthocytophaga flavus]